LAFNSGQASTKGFLFFRISNAAHENLSEWDQIMITFASFFGTYFGNTA